MTMTRAEQEAVPAAVEATYLHRLGVLATGASALRPAYGPAHNSLHGLTCHGRARTGTVTAAAWEAFVERLSADRKIGSARGGASRIPSSLMGKGKSLGFRRYRSLKPMTHA